MRSPGGRPLQTRPDTGGYSPAALPSHLPGPGERLSEIAAILADGLMRLRTRQSSGMLPGEADFSLDTLGQQSGAVAGKEGDTL
jgi:hypothetical protein